MNQTLFTEIIEALRGQYDKDAVNAKRLSDIYGSDINPNDNKLLTQAIFKLLHKTFPPKGDCYIEIFCYDQDFGRKSNKTIEDLWNELIMDFDVVDPEIVKPSIH